MRSVLSTRLFFTVVVAALPLAASPAAAQSIAEPGTWSVTPLLGSSMGIDDDAGAGNSVLLGVGFGYDLTSNIGFEGELGHLFDVSGNNQNIDW